MADTSQINKIYDLRIAGYDDTIQKLNAINQAFIEIRKNKVNLNNQKARTEDPAELERINKLLQEQKVKEAELRLEKVKATNEAKAAAVIKQQDINIQKAKIEGNRIEAGSYSAIVKAQKELYALLKPANQNSIIDFQGQLLGFDQAIAKYKELSAAEQTFRRQFTQDKTLVGEYTTGIVQAFKQMGLGDLVGGQVSQAQAKIASLNAAFESLKQELNTVKNAGLNFQGIEQKLISNRQEVIALEQEVGRLNTAFRGAGDIGNQITTGIATGFKNAAGQIGQLILSYVGFQAAFQGIISGFGQAIRIDSLQTALANVSVSEEELAKNTEFLRTTTQRLGLTLLDSTQAFKNFYAAATQAGIGADATRDIFTAAASASANLKLSQEDTNGVLLAFGQIASKGKVQAEELRGQIGERIPGAFSIAARAIGVTQQELNKMLENGEVLATEFLPKFAAELQKTFGVDATKQVTGLQASINRLKNGITELLTTNQKSITTIINGFLALGTVVLGTVSLIVGNLPAIIAVFGLLTAAYVANNYSLLLLRGQIFLYNAALLAQRTAVGLLTIAQGAYTAMMGFLTGITTSATIATRLLGFAMRALPIGLVLTLIGVLVATFRAFGSAIAGTTAELRRHAIQQQLTADISKRVSDATTDQISKTQSYIQVLRAEGVSLETKKKVLADLIAQSPEYLSGLTLANVATQEGINIIDNYIAALRNKAAEEAAQSIRSEKLKKDIELSIIQRNLETRIATGKGTELGDLSDEEKEFISTARKNFAFTASVTDLVTGSNAAKEALAAIQAQRANITVELDETDALIKRRYTDIGKNAVGGAGAASAAGAKQVDIDIEALKAQLDALDKQIEKFKGSQKDLNLLIAERKKLQDQLDAALGTGNKARTSRGSRLTGEQRDAFKDIDALRDEQLASAKLTRTELSKEYGFRAQDEIAYLNRVLSINDTALSKKLSIIKGKNAEERKIIAELKLDRITQEISTNEAIFKIREQALQEEFDREKKAAENQASEILNDPRSKEFQRTQAKLDADQAIMASQIRFDAAMDRLEKEFGLKSKKNAEDRLLALKALGIQIQKEIVDNTKAGIEQQLKDTEDSALKSINELKQSIAEQTVAILDNDNLSPAQKAGQINQLEENAKPTFLANEVAQAQIQLPLYKRLLDQKLITEQQYNAKVTELKEKQAALAQSVADKEQNALTRTTQYFKEAIANLTGFFKGVKATQADINGALDAAVKNVEDAVGQAFQSYFAGEQRKVDQSRELAQERLDLEKDQVSNKAQSEAEKESIERQYKLKAEALDKEAGEKRKKIAIKQMAIEFGLAALKTLAAYPFPYSLIPVAGLALAYAVKLADVKSQTFEQGGNPDLTTTRGGKVKGRPHSQGGNPFVFKGRVFEDEVDELNVIRTKNAPANKSYQITGTHTEIASMLNRLGGGIDFKPGAKLRKLEYGGNLGESLQAPVFTPSVVTVGGSSASNDRLMEVITEQTAEIRRQTAAINGRIDRIEVRQVTSTVTDAQKKYVRQSNVGTL